MPETIGRYEVLLPIASGGMGTVYLARSRGVGGFKREVAVKVMHAHLREEEHFSTDLVEEAKLAVRIQHPNVVQVLDVGEDPHGVFLVMEYIEGESYAGLQRAARKREEHIPVGVGVRVMVDALLGLHAAHEVRDETGELVGLVHRDFSPQNILVGVDGLSKLTDFGVAKAKTRLSHTATGLVKGKIHYMSPEQARTETIDRRCDVWAGGVMVWETLAGRRLYKEKGDAAILLKLVTEPPPRLRTVRRDIPQALEDVVHSALTPDPEKRCASARLFAEQLLEASAALGGAASHEEVAAYIRTTSGANLAKRRAQVVDVLKLREEMRSIAAESTLDTADLTTSPARGSAGVSRSARTSSHGDDFEDDTTLRVADDAPVGPVAAQPVTVHEDEQTDVTHSSPAIVTPPRRSNLPVIVAAATAVLGTSIYVLTRTPEPTSSGGSAPSAIISSPAASPPSAPPSAGSAKPATNVVVLVFESDTAMAAITLGDEVVNVPGPAKRVEARRDRSKLTAPLTVTAKAADGRVSKATLNPGETSLRIQFPKRPATIPTPNQPRPTHPRPVQPRPTAPKTVAPLATNPHTP